MKEDLIYQRMLEADESRGHRFIGPEKIPALYATENVKLADKVVAAHYFAGDRDWFVFEFDPATGDAFTLTRNRLTEEEELGYTNLIRLGQQTIKNRIMIANGYETVFELFIERDCYWTPTTISEVRLRDGSTLTTK